MSFDDLPRDWPSRPLRDPDFTADVLDLCVSDQDRTAGGLAVLFCRRDDTLAQPVFVGDIPDEQGLLDALVSLGRATVEMPPVAGAVMAIVRPWGAVCDGDRRAHQQAIEVCRGVGITLLGMYVVTRTSISCLPVAPELVRGTGAA
ncbi:MAG: hypothetical protein Q4P07_08480 [Ornithinimicrobium sp.]|uniref:hypothetical protein n=1 Tax=Ornithinimicrobium sp. TaxID=1977084 RepID=UPI0026E10EB8|nr:hypothetical protein [Ornithinimicrobium sp.]MDO5740169.1 hypothetical protein [Ornithinimicrobium sp.]